MEVLEENREVEELTLECHALVEDPNTLRECSRLLRERGKKLRDGKALMEG